MILEIYFFIIVVADVLFIYLIRKLWWSVGVGPLSMSLIEPLVF